MYRPALPLFLLIFSALLPSLAFSETNADKSATQSPRVIIVLDASGSMWGQIKNEAKISIAKDVVSDIVKDLDPQTELGLTVYGHRKKGDCNDIEAVVPISPIEKTSFTNVLKKISPKGKTPLSKAVIQAAEELKYEEDKATVILVSDGIETCDLDPCEVATNLEKSGVDFTTHVIGFDIQEEDARKQLTCLAENTGGKFMTASDASSLKSSLEEAVAAAAKSEPTVKFVAVHEEGGEPIDMVSWHVFKADSEGNKQGTAIHYGRGDTPQYELEAGTYLATVESTRGKAKAQKVIVVPEGLEEGQVEEVVLAEEGKVKLVAVTEEGGTPLDQVSWHVHTIPANDLQKGEVVTYGGGNTPEYLLLPGKYLASVKSSRGKAEAKQEIEVLAGKKETIEVILAEEGKVKLVAVTEEGGTPLDQVSWNVHTIPANDMQKGELVSYGGGNTPEYLLLPGKYIASVKSSRGKAETKQEIEVIAGKKNTIEVVMAEEGKVKLVAVNTEGGEPIKEVSWKVHTIPADDMTKKELVSYGGGGTPEYLLLPGKYLASVQSRGGKATAEQEIEVIAGKKNTIEVVMPAEGILKLAAVTSEGGPALDGVSWKVHTVVPEDSMQSKELVSYGGGTSPEYKILPGEYEVEVRSVKGKATASQIVTVEPGKRNTVEVLMPAEGEIELIALEKAGAAPLKTASWKLMTKVPEDSLQTSETIHYGGGATPTYRLLPGTYVAQLKVRNTDIELEKEVTVVAGKRVTEKIVITDEGASTSNG